MSRFWGSVSDESSSESDSDFEDNQQQQSKQAARFLRPVESDSEDEKRVVRSKDQKFRDELSSILSQIRGAKHNNDWSKIEDLYGQMTKTLDKHKTSLPTTHPHRLFLKGVVELEDGIEEAWPKRKSFNKTAATALSKLRTTLRKLKRDSEYAGKPLDEFMQEERENPAAESEPEEEESDDEDFKPQAKRSVSKSESESESESDDEDDDKKKPVKKAALADDESDSEFWASSDEEEESSDDEQGAGYSQYSVEFFLKKTPSDADKGKKKKPHKAHKPKAKTEDDDGDFIVVGRPQKKEQLLFQPEDKITHEAVMSKLTEIKAMRGRRGQSIVEQRKLLRNLRQIADANDLGLGLSLKIHLLIIAMHFDEPLSVAGYMKPFAWAACHDDVMELLDILIKNDQIQVLPTISEEEEVIKAGESIKLNGDVVSFVERLDDEFTKSLQHIDPHTPDFVVRLRDDAVLYNLICLAQKYLEKLDNNEFLGRVVLRRVEHLYYKRNYVATSHHKPTQFLPSELEEQDQAAYKPDIEELPDREPVWIVDDAEESDSSKLMDRLCKFLYKKEHNFQQGDRIRARAILCHAYHHCIFDRWQEARDLVLMSHLQESITHTDIPTQILYNRTMVQLGLCAFRNGKVHQAQAALVEIFQLGRLKELLAQGIQNNRFSDKSAEDIKIEKRRQTPFHMHINIEMIEVVFHTTAMLLEIPRLAHARNDPTRHHNPIKPFRRQLDFFCKQVFNGPPENARDHVMAAALSMLKCDWQGCVELLRSLKTWNLFANKDSVLDMLETQVKVETLRTYLFSNSGHYETMSIETLSSIFDLPEAKVHSVVSKMIFYSELYASHDQSTKTIVIHKEEPTSLQRSALQFADKINAFSDTNERLLQLRQSSTGSGDSKGGFSQGGGYRRNQRGGGRFVRPYRSDAFRSRKQDNRSKPSTGNAWGKAN